jgi:hypothetical protein
MGEGRLSGDEPPTNQRLTVPEAASWLGITEAAVRGRIKRGTLRSYREEGNVYVVLVGDESRGESTANRDAPATDPREELVEELRGQVDYLQGIIGTRDRELSEMRRLLAGALERIPEIEAPRDSPPEGALREAPPEPHGPETKGAETTEGTDTPTERSWGQAETGVQRRERRASWWRRFFGFD